MWTLWPNAGCAKFQIFKTHGLCSWLFKLTSDTATPQELTQRNVLQSNCHAQNPSHQRKLSLKQGTKERTTLPMSSSCNGSGKHAKVTYTFVFIYIYKYGSQPSVRSQVFRLRRLEYPEDTYCHKHSLLVVLINKSRYLTAHLKYGVQIYQIYLRSKEQEQLQSCIKGSRDNNREYMKEEMIDPMGDNSCMEVLCVQRFIHCTPATLTKDAMFGRRSGPMYG